MTLGIVPGLRLYDAIGVTRARHAAPNRGSRRCTMAGAEILLALGAAQV